MPLLKHNNYFIFCLVLLFTACKNNTKSSDTSVTNIPTDKNVKPAIKLPETPEALVRAWEENVNNNEFELPRMVSKGEVLNLVNSVEASNADQKLPVFPMKILSIKCDDLNNIGNCTCHIQNDTGEQTFLYTLIKDDGQWFLTKVESEDELASPGKTNKDKSLKSL